MNARRAASMLLLVAVAAGAAAGQQTPPAQNDAALEAETRAVAARLRCPVCQGLSIQDSPSELAQEMKDVVRDQLRSGKSPEQVKGYFVSKYGEWILLEPEPHGFNLAVYLLPVLGLVAGLGIVVVAVRRWTHAAPAAQTAGDSPPSEATPARLIEGSERA